MYFLPDLATCNFEVKNGCHYVLDHSSMDFYWTRGIAKENNTYIEDPSRGSSGENHVVETSEKTIRSPELKADQNLSIVCPFHHHAVSL